MSSQNLGFFHCPYITYGIICERTVSMINHFRSARTQLSSVPCLQGHHSLSWFSEITSNSFPLYFLLSIIHRATRKHINHLANQNHSTLTSNKLHNAFCSLKGDPWWALATSPTASPLPHSFLPVALSCPTRQVHSFCSTSDWRILSHYPKPFLLSYYPFSSLSLSLPRPQPN